MLQRVAECHRTQFSIPVVGITGSNGKTIVKDWIVQLLSTDHNIAASPKSYNSQIGVPLSVWQMSGDNDMAVFEAGISEAGKMEALRNVIQPTIGIFTNIGQAHDENFLTRRQKIAEKLQLFTHCEVLIYCLDHRDIHSVISEKESLHGLNRFTWGSSDENAVQLHETIVKEHSTILNVSYKGQPITPIEIPFIDRASVENAMHCITLMFYLGYDGQEIAARCRSLSPVAMRLEMGEGINNCLLVNDSYSMDLNSLSIALDFVQHEHQHFHKTLIMSDILQSGLPEQELYSQVVSLIRQRGIDKLIGIGSALMRNRTLFEDLATYFYPTTEEFLLKHPFSDFQNETILLKGARVFCFENIAKVLQRKRHETIMEVNLDALVQNVNYYRSHMMNPEEESFDNIIRYSLEPDIYSFRILQLFSDAARLYADNQKPIAIHIELDTGMHRLGFAPDDMDRLAQLLKADDSPLVVRSIFSHLACSEDPAMDDFTRMQISRFRQGSARLKQLMGRDDILCHILNSSGITRFPEAQMDMVRLGIGLYGISPEPDVQRMLMPVSTLKTRISQIKDIPLGDSVGYNRRWIAERDSRIAIIPIGYADGLSRHLGYGRGSVEINGIDAPIIGSICMDMCFIDVTDVPCAEGDEVVVFGSASQLCRMAEAAGTIPYEILTSVSPRVKRVYVSE